MTTIRVREPSNDGRLTIEWYAVMGDGAWMLLDGGNIVSIHDWKWQARLARRLLLRQRQPTDIQENPA
jgi:hypothetical protein